ncbi:MAG: ABC transporter permease DevC [Kiritimatiellae bacterium]|nr:ABC transporter permease DevC [Kiritimatiellia bacterium]
MKGFRKIAALWVPGGIPLAWRQLMAEKKRFMVAVAGVSFGVLLMLFQLGIFQAFMLMVVRPIDAMKGELAMISKDFQYIMTTEPFPERRLYQALAIPEVQAVYPLMMLYASWRNPDTGKQCELALFGLRPSANPFVLPDIIAREEVLALPDGALYDECSTPDYGDIVSLLERDGVIQGEVNKRRVRVLDSFQMGQTLAAYGHILCGMETFRRLTDRKEQVIELGMIELREGADPVETAARLNALLPGDVEVIPREEFAQKEKEYWQANTPLGFIVTAGMIIAMFVGAVIVYQILYTDINDHIKEYATLKALGYSDGFFLRLILQEAAILPLFGFLPGMLCSAGLFYLADTQGGLPTRLTVSDTLLVFALTTLMCFVAGILATRRLRAADPADIF